MTMKETYPSTYLGDIKTFLEHRGFKLDKNSACGGFHFTAQGARLQVIDDLGQPYEILMNPVFKKENDNGSEHRKV